MTPTPVKIDVNREAREVLIRWSNGAEHRLPNRYLRGWCPCAACQGHGGERKYVVATADDIKGLRPVGNYAVAVTWSDGHDTGIYSWGYLHEILTESQYTSRMPKAYRPAAEGAAPESRGTP